MKPWEATVHTMESCTTCCIIKDELLALGYVVAIPDLEASAKTDREVSRQYEAQGRAPVIEIAGRFIDPSIVLGNKLPKAPTPTAEG